MEWIALEGTGIGRVWDGMGDGVNSELKACDSSIGGLVYGYSPFD